MNFWLRHIFNSQNGKPRPQLVLSTQYLSALLNLGSSNIQRSHSRTPHNSVALRHVISENYFEAGEGAIASAFSSMGVQWCYSAR